MERGAPLLMLTGAKQRWSRHVALGWINQAGSLTKMLAVATLLPECAAQTHLLVWFCSFLVNNLHSFALAQFAKIEQTVQFSVIMLVQDRSKVWLREALSELKRHLVEMEHEKKMKICLNWLWSKWERIEHNSVNTLTELEVFVFPLLL